MTDDFITVSGDRLTVRGRWTVETLEGLIRALGAVSPDRVAIIDAADLIALDTAGASYLSRLAQGMDVRNIPSHLQPVYDRIHGLDIPPAPPVPPAPPLPYAMVAGLGCALEEVRADLVRGIGFFGAFLSGFPARMKNPRAFRLRSVVFHINEVGIKALPIIALMAFAIAFVTGYQGAFQLQKFDATIYTVDLIVLSTLREMGVLITAIMVAGRSGSAFAAQIGTMKLNEEVDALRTMGVDPFEALVLPRMLAILVALPLLTVVANFSGLLGGYIFSSGVLDISPAQFLTRMQDVAELRHFYVGLSKAPVFALLIGIVGCMQGLRASGSAEDVGRKTITAVVQSIFLVIVADAVFSVIFTKLGL